MILAVGFLVDLDGGREMISSKKSYYNYMIKEINFKKYKNNIILVNELFLEYLKFVTALCCKRCWTVKYNKNNHNGEHRHHQGAILYLLAQEPKISNSQFQAFLGDTEHGLFHGICAGFWVFLQHNKSDLFDKIFTMQTKLRVSQKANQVEKLFYSVFFHDFHRCVFDDSAHDQKLELTFPLCDPATYSHSNPPEKYQNHSLITADRIELNRYEDKSWIDQKKLNKNLFIRQNNYLIQFFYNNLMPALRNLYINLDSLWIKHRSEDIFVHDGKFQHLTQFPEKYWEPREADISGTAKKGRKLTDFEKKHASIDIDYLPLINCHEHTVKWIRSGIMGMMTKDDVKKAGCKILVSPDSTFGRDHPFLVMDEKITLDKWIFCYGKNEELDSINAIGQKIVSANVVNAFYATTKLLQGRIEGFKVQ